MLVTKNYNTKKKNIEYIDFYWLQTVEKNMN